MEIQARIYHSDTGPSLRLMNDPDLPPDSALVGWGELADCLGSNTRSIRRHFDWLKRNGIIDYTSTRRGTIVKLLNSDLFWEPLE